MDKSEYYLKNVNDNFLKKRKKRLTLLISLLFAVMVLGVNVYAWFVFINDSNVDLNFDVIKWDVVFTHDGSETNSLSFTIDDAYPGMPTYERSVVVLNKSDVSGTLLAKINSINLFGNELVTSNDTDEEILDKINNFYPFTVTISKNKNILATNEEGTFIIRANWTYDNNEVRYYKLESYHEYDPSATYYLYNGTNYTEASIADSASFAVNKNNLFVDKDYADTYFGIRCGDYTNTTGEACIKIGITLVLEQYNS